MHEISVVKKALKKKSGQVVTCCCFEAPPKECRVVLGKAIPPLPALVATDKKLGNFGGASSSHQGSSRFFPGEIVETLRLATRDEHRSDSAEDEEDEEVADES